VWRRFRVNTDQLLAALVITLVLMGLAALAPALAHRLNAPVAPAVRPTPTPTEPPAAVLLPDEQDKALEGVMILANDRNYGTAFLIDAQGDLLTASSLVHGATGLRLIDNTGGSHPARVLADDTYTGVAMVRATVDGTPLALGEPVPAQLQDPLVLLASPKVGNLSNASPAVVTKISTASITLRVNDLPGNLGGPVVGPGAKVVAVLTSPGTGTPIELISPLLAQWRVAKGTLLPLAPFPAGLQLRGSDTTVAPSASAPGTVSVSGITPKRASAASETTLIIQGSGFLAGPGLRVHFVPVAGGSGAFDGTGAALSSPSTLTVKVPAGHAVQDYVVQVVNGDGIGAASRPAFTLTS
jgi:hypothetical protein